MVLHLKVVYVVQHLSLLDAGVPLKDMVAGIAMGLIKHDDKSSSTF